ncbi:hypothetical protein ACFE04_028712 [Oxalis oulophora]
MFSPSNSNGKKKKGKSPMASSMKSVYDHNEEQLTYGKQQLEHLTNDMMTIFDRIRDDGFTEDAITKILLEPTAATKANEVYRKMLGDERDDLMWLTPTKKDLGTSFVGGSKKSGNKSINID